MVWSTTQSALYNDLSRYYEDEKKPQKCCSDPSKDLTSNYGNNSPENRSNKSPEKCCSNFTENCGNISENNCGNKNLPVCPNCPHMHKNSGDPISRIISEKISDKDMILIAGLIFLLMKQGADKKLILALAFVFLS